MGEFVRDNGNGRPDGTSLRPSGQHVIHYTCNPPHDEALADAGMRPVGQLFGVGETEVILIPAKLFDVFDGRIDTIEAEQLLRDVDRRK